MGYRPRPVALPHAGLTIRTGLKGVSCPVPASHACPYPCEACPLPQASLSQGQAHVPLWAVPLALTVFYSLNSV